MKNLKIIALMLILNIVGLTIATAKEESKIEKQHNEHIQEIFMAWDTEKGNWLYESMGAIIMNEPAPERVNGIDKTTFELLSEMTNHRKNRILRAAASSLEEEQNQRNQNRRTTDGDSSENERYYWEEFMELINRTNCEVSQGRSNGDPHIRSYDGKRYDFQTAGEYLLTTSLRSNFDIQTRQVRHNEKISVNAAAILNVNGDIVSIYAQDFPDEFTDKNLRINNQVIENDATPIYLENGGIIKKTRNRYVVLWPTGEQAHFRKRSFQQSNLIDIDVFVPSCGREDYDGLLGNADGKKETDLIVKEPVENDLRTVATADRTFDAVFGAGRHNDKQRNAQQRELEFLSRDFGNQFILDEENSMFEVPMGLTPDEIRYPSEHLTLADLTDDEIKEGTEKCRSVGVDDQDLMACVYDYGFVNLAPELPAEYVAPNKPSNEKTAPNLNPEIQEEDNNRNNPDASRVLRNILIGISRGGGVGGNTRTAPSPSGPAPSTRTPSGR